jgi:GNAT superfamily N-acetyltransferase
MWTRCGSSEFGGWRTTPLMYASSHDRPRTSMNQTTQIRLATVDDIAALKILIQDSVRQLSTGFLTSEQIAAELEFVIHLDTQLIDDRTYYVAVTADGRIAGAGGWSRRRGLHGGDAYRRMLSDRGEEPDALVDPSREPARIRQMFTHPAWARRGIGRRIFEVARAAAQREGFLEMVLTATMPGVPLYEALGFRMVRRYTETLPNGVAVPVAEMTRVITLEGSDAAASA